MIRRVVSALLFLAASAATARAEPPPGFVIPGGQEALLRRLLTPAEPPATAWTVTAIEARDDRIVARYAARAGDAAFTAELRHPTAAAPDDVRTERFAVRFGAAGPPAEVRAALVRQIRAHEGGFLWKRHGPRPPPGPAAAESAAPAAAAPAPPDWQDPGRTAVVRSIALVLVALFLVALLPLAGAVRAALAALGRTERLVLGAATAAGLLVRLLAPHRFVKVFMGYREVNAAWDLVRLPKYGSSAPALHHYALHLGPAEYDTVLYLHSILGALTVPLVALWFRRLGAPRGAVGVAAAVLALLPLFVKDHNSESYLVPSLFWLSAGLLLLTAAADGRRLAWPAAALALGLSCMARPFSFIFAPALTLLTLIGADLPRGALRRSLSWALPSAVVMAALLVPNALHVLAAARAGAAAGALPGLAGADLCAVPGKLLTENIAFDPAFVPTALPALALLAPLLARGRLRRNLVALAVLAAAWWAVNFIDLPPVSRPRLQVPGLVAVTLMAAAGAVLLVERVRALGRVAAARWLAAALAVVVAASSAVTIPALWARGNADEEADAFAEAIRHLPRESVLFVRLGEGDEPRWQVHRASPDRLPLTIGRGDTVIGIRDFFDLPPTDRPVYAWLGLRCHAASREGRGGSPLAPRRQHPLCERLRALPLVPVFERDVPNHPHADFPWYPEDRPTLRVGLYRVAATAAGAPPEAERDERP